MMADWNLHMQKQYICDYMLGEGGSRRKLLLLCPACVVSWEPLIGLCMIQNVGLRGPLVWSSMVVEE